MIKGVYKLYPFCVRKVGDIMFDTKELGAGSYPEPPEIEERTIKIKCSFNGYVSVPTDWDYNKIEEYIKDLSIDELTTETDTIEIDDIEY